MRILMAKTTLLMSCCLGCSNCDSRCLYFLMFDFCWWLSLSLLAPQDLCMYVIGEHLWEAVRVAPQVGQRRKHFRMCTGNGIWTSVEKAVGGAGEVNKEQTSCKRDKALSVGRCSSSSSSSSSSSNNSSSPSGDGSSQEESALVESEPLELSKHGIANEKMDYSGVDSDSDSDSGSDSGSKQKKQQQQQQHQQHANDSEEDGLGPEHDYDDHHRDCTESSESVLCRSEGRLDVGKSFCQEQDGHEWESWVASLQVLPTRTKCQLVCIARCVSKKEQGAWLWFLNSVAVLRTR